MGRDEHDWSRTVRRHLADFHAEFKTGLSRHLNIEKDKVEMILLEQTLRGERIIQAHSTKVGLSERGTDRFT